MHSLLSRVQFAFRHPVVRSGGVAVAGTASIFVIVFLFFWYPSSSKYFEIRQDIDQLRNKLVVIKQLNDLEPTYFAAEKTLKKVEEKLNLPTSLAEFTTELYKLASRNNIKIISKSSHDIQIKQDYKILYQELTLQGRYESMRQFILSLRDMPTWTLIKEARFKTKKGSNELIGEFALTSYQKNKSI